MRENRMRSSWRDGGTVVNGWLGIPSAFAAETMAHQGWESLTVAQIETAEAIDNIDEIAATPGLDAFYIGPVDLGLSYGFGPSFDRTEPELVEAIDKVLGAAARDIVDSLRGEAG